jgi:hypothetical protein
MTHYKGKSKSATNTAKRKLLKNFSDYTKISNLTLTSTIHGALGRLGSSQSHFVPQGRAVTMQGWENWC